MEPEATRTSSARRLRRWERAAAAAIALGPLLLILLHAALSPSVPLLFERPGTGWLAAPLPVGAALEQWGRVEAPKTRFLRSFELPAAVATAGAELELRVHGCARVLWNGRELPLDVPADAERGRRSLRLELGDALQPGINRLEIEVENPRGPALIALASRGFPAELGGPAQWSVEHAGRLFATARAADDTLRNPLTLAVDSPAEALAGSWPLLLGFFGLAAFGHTALAGRALTPRAAVLVFSALAGAGWLWLFVARFLRLPAEIGFDAKHHLEYLRILLDEGRVPLASEGWSTYHPPLVYALTALLSQATGLFAATRAINTLAGLAIAALAFRLARRLFPERPRLALVAGLFAAVLPVNVYSAAYFSNEAGHAALASAALVACVDLLLRERIDWGRGLALAALFALAALAKFSVIAALPVALAFVGWKLLRLERRPIGRVAGGLAAGAALFTALCGGYYLRNWIHYGTPLIGNWALPEPGQTWWQQPGFHTPAYYLRFGESLAHPYLAGFHSFWDGLYCTFWGDGYIGGRADPTQRHELWNYGLMTSGYWLALPASALLVAGALRGVALALGSGPARQRLALAFLASTGWAVFLAGFALTLTLPYFAQAKAAYLLMLAAPLALAFALGVEAVDERLAARGWQGARHGLAGYLGCLFATLYFSFAG